MTAGSMASIIFETMLVVIAVWPVATFGAVYPWTYIPLLIACAITGLFGIALSDATPRINRRVAVALAVIALAVGLQLIPLSAPQLRRVSPETDAFLRFYDISYAIQAEQSGPAAETAAHPLSIEPGATILGLCSLAAFGIFLLGVSANLTVAGVRRFVNGLAAIGLVLALVGIVQRATFNGKLYWLWTPQFDAGNSFGPFVNRNHFAGWMIMALGLVVGSLVGEVASRAHDPQRDWRSRLLWYSSPAASRIALVTFATLVMSLALVLTISRSGLLSFLLAIALAVVVVLRRVPRGGRRFLVVAYLIALVAVAIGWTGVARISARFSQPENLIGRIAAWHDTLDVIRRFPLAGTGLDTYGTSMLRYQRSNLKFHMAEAHNDYLQLASEGGLLVGVPAVFALVVFALEVGKAFRAARRGTRSYWIQAGAITGLAAIAFQETVEFSLQIPGNAALFSMLAAIALSPFASEPVTAAPKPALA